MILKSYAKINLSLDLVGKREDGYHLLKTVMQTVSLCDIVSLERIESGIEISCNRRYIPTDERNIVHKVATAFFNHTGIKGGVRIGLKKYIPCGAGLGGGSSNGAVVLDGLCKLYDISIPVEQKVKITQSIGADIPFFFYGGTALCEGIGEKITPLKSIPKCWFVLAKPPVSLSTAAVFTSPLTAENFGGNSTDGVISGIENSSLLQIAKSAQNALEPASLQLCSKIQKLKKMLSDSGAVMSMMSGSGSTVYGMFTSHAQARTAYYKMKIFCKDTYIVKPI